MKTIRCQSSPGLRAVERQRYAKRGSGLFLLAWEKRILFLFGLKFNLKQMDAHSGNLYTHITHNNTFSVVTTHVAYRIQRIWPFI